MAKVRADLLEQLERCHQLSEQTQAKLRDECSGKCFIMLIDERLSSRNVAFLNAAEESFKKIMDNDYAILKYYN